MFIAAHVFLTLALLIAIWIAWLIMGPSIGGARTAHFALFAIMMALAVVFRVFAALPQ